MVMEKTGQKTEAPRALLGAMLALAALAGMLWAAGAPSAPETRAECITIPQIEILTPLVDSSVGRVRYVDVKVSATHPPSCAKQEYGVDFTDAYSARYFVLGMEKSNTRFLFNLSSGESRVFRGVVGIPLNAPLGEHRLQMTAYSPADIWKQVSANVSVQVRPFAGSDLLWRTNLTLGWNIIPSMEGAAFLGCEDIRTAYRYSPTKGDYIELERYGAQFVPKAGEPDVPDERGGGLAMFVRKRCTISTVADSGRLDGQQLNLTSNRERSLTVPYPWYGKTKSQMLAAYCPKADADAIAFNYWDAARQRWEPANERPLFAGQVLYIRTGSMGGACALPLEG